MGFGYRFAFNGQEQDNEIAGSGNSYDLGLRNYDPRLGRMFKTDPRESEYPWQSTYAYYANSPIFTIDYLGGGKNDWVEGADGNITWRDDIKSQSDLEEGSGDIWRGTYFRRFEDVGDYFYRDVTYHTETTFNERNYAPVVTPISESLTKFRPDVDGIVTDQEAVLWYHFGGGSPLTVDISKFKFKSSVLSVEHFEERGVQSLSVNFFNAGHFQTDFDILWKPASDETLSDVYGTLRVVLAPEQGPGKVRIATSDLLGREGSIDMYDFRFFGETLIGLMHKGGDMTPFLIYPKANTYGTINLTYPKVPISFPSGNKF